MICCLALSALGPLRIADCKFQISKLVIEVIVVIIVFVIADVSAIVRLQLIVVFKIAVAILTAFITFVHRFPFQTAWAMSSRLWLTRRVMPAALDQARNAVSQIERSSSLKSRQEVLPLQTIASFCS